MLTALHNDLHLCFGPDCDPVSLGDATFSSISWADDLLLMSTSYEGLQSCPNSLVIAVTSGA